MGRYQADSTDSTKSGPKGLHTEDFGKSILPAAETIYDRPNYVIDPGNQAGAIYAFAYESGSTSTYITGSSSQKGGAIKLGIQPVAWRRTDGASTLGDIVFVYRGGR